MLRDNLVGLIVPMRSCGTQALGDEFSYLENPRPVGAESSLTGRCSSPFQTEARQEEWHGGSSSVTRALANERLRGFCGRSFWSLKNGPTNCREPGEGIHCWGECIFLLIVPGQNGWRNCGVGTKRREFCHHCMDATDWSIWRAWKAQLGEQLSAEGIRGASASLGWRERA